MITLAKKSQYPALQAMWSRCFDDGAQYPAFLFRNLLYTRNILVYNTDGGTPVGMLCYAPFDLQGPAACCRACYIFGVATLPEHRGKGISTQLLEGAHRLLAKSGVAASVLVPASQSLFDFYGRRGYAAAFSIRKQRFPAADRAPTGENCVLIPAALEGLADLRAGVFGGSRMFVRWGEDYLRYIDRECRFLGGEVLKIAVNGERGYAVCYRGTGDVLVKELALSPQNLETALYALHRRFAAKSYTLYLPVDFPLAADNPVLPFGMVRWYDRKKQNMLEACAGKEPYLAHVLD